MILTKNEILTDIWRLVSESDIATSISGNVIKSTRATDSKLEDCVISIIPGVSQKLVQDGAILIKIYYNDIKSGNTFYEDMQRGEVLERLLIEFSEYLLENNKYAFEGQTRETYTASVQEADTQQHYAILKINFKKIIR